MDRIQLPISKVSGCGGTSVLQSIIELGGLEHATSLVSRTSSYLGNTNVITCSIHAYCRISRPNMCGVIGIG